MFSSEQNKWFILLQLECFEGLVSMSALKNYLSFLALSISHKCLQWIHFSDEVFKSRSYFKYCLYILKKTFQGITFLICSWLCKYFQLNISMRLQTNMTLTWSVYSIYIEVSFVIYVRMCCSKYVFYKKENQYWIKKRLQK